MPERPTMMRQRIPSQNIDATKLHDFLTTFNDPNDIRISRTLDKYIITAPRVLTLVSCSLINGNNHHV